MQVLTEILSGMYYPGRGIIAGRNEEGNNVLVYFLTGRSPSSKARMLKLGQNTGAISTDVTDPTQLASGSSALLLYPAIIPSTNGIVISNGSQTNLLNSAISSSEHLFLSGNRDDRVISMEIMRKAFDRPSLIHDAQKDRMINQASYEPDSPNNTPRINLVALNNGGTFHNVRYNSMQRPEHSFWDFGFERGAGLLLTTYSGENKDPLPSFAGPPVVGTLVDFNNVTKTANSVYGALNPSYRIAVAALHVDSKKGNIIDRHIINPAEEEDFK